MRESGGGISICLRAMIGPSKRKMESNPQEAKFKKSNQRPRAKVVKVLTKTKSEVPQFKIKGQRPEATSKENSSSSKESKKKNQKTQPPSSPNESSARESYGR
ncbi:unnamed protein product [Rhodiola kirilowii]